MPNFGKTAAQTAPPHFVFGVFPDPSFTKLSIFHCDAGVEAGRGQPRRCISLSSLTIPDSVTSLGAGAFYQDFKLNTITIPNSVPSIGDSLFYECYDLGSVTIPDSVTSIADDAFYNCYDLTNVTIGTRVASIGYNAFNNCPLTSLMIPNNVTSIGDDAFAGCSLTNVTIGNGVTSIADGVFDLCTNLSSVMIPDTVTSIGDGAFSFCSSLTNVTVGSGVTNIADYAFMGCSSLTTACFWGNAPSADSTVFYNDLNVTAYYYSGTSGWGSTFAGIPTMEVGEMQTQFNYTVNNGTITITGYTGPGGMVTIPGTLNNLAVTSLGDFAFYENSSLTSVTIPNSVTSIGGAAFAFCTSLTSVTIPDSVTSIGASAFVYCSSLASVTMGNGITSIPEDAFSATSLTSVKIPNSVTSIGDGAFEDTSLTSITIPNSVTTIGDDAFDLCGSLTNAIIPNSVTSIGSGGFSGTSLISVTIPNSITSIADDAFAGCSHLTKVTIPNSITSIGDDAFENTSLTSITIPNSVTSIGDDAFYGSSLTSITIPNSVTSVGQLVFSFCASLTNVTISTNITSIGLGTFQGTALATITIPNSVTSIGDYAFAGCPSLTGVYFNGNAPTAESIAFNGDYNVTAYYYSGASGWGSTFAGIPCVMLTGSPQGAPPNITNQPKSQTVNAGSNAIFTVGAIGTPALFYQWQENGTNISDGPNLTGTITATLTIVDASVIDAANYTVVVSNSAGTLTSSIAALSINQEIGLIPAQNVFQGLSLTNTSNKTYPTAHLGPALLSDNLWGLSSSLLETGQVTMNYSPNQGLLSNSITLGQMNMTGGVAGYPEIQYGFSPNSSNYSDPGGTTLFPMKLGNLTHFEDSGGFWSVVNYLITPAPPPNPVDFTYDIWITSNNAPTGISSTTVELMIWLYENNLTPIGGTPRIMGLLLPCLVKGQQESLPFDVYASTNPTTNGVTVSFVLETPLSDGSIGIDLSKITSLLGSELQSWYNNSAWTQNSLNDYYVLDVELGSEFKGDLLFAANYGWSVSNYFFLYTVVPSEAPQIMQAPESLTVMPSTNVTFTVAASGATPLYYQWQRNGRNAVNGGSISGATSSALAIANVQANSDGNYTVVVTNSFGSVTSSPPAMLIVDGQKPTNQILLPSAVSTVSNALFTVTGKAGDNVAVESVWCQLNSSGWDVATTTNSWSNWTAQVSLVPGTNVFQAYAVDTAGNRSTTNSVSLVYVLNGMLTVHTNGNGTISPNYGGALLQIGHNYSMTAKAGTGFAFTNWTGGTNPPLSLLTNRPTLTIQDGVEFGVDCQLCGRDTAYHHHHFSHSQSAMEQQHVHRHGHSKGQCPGVQRVLPTQRQRLGRWPPPATPLGPIGRPL